MVCRLACTVQPKARPASDTVTVAGSGLTGTPARPKIAPDGTRRASPVTRSGVSRTSTWPSAPAIVQAAAAGPRRATSFAHQHLLPDPFAAA